MKADRDIQAAEALAITAELRQQGWKKVVISVTRGGTLRVEAEAGEDAQPKRHQWEAK
jgi:fructose-1-phosphate kinase PfkB-like protein